MTALGPHDEPEPIDILVEMLRRSFVFTDEDDIVERIDTFSDRRSNRCRYLVVWYRGGEVTTVRVVERAGIGGYAVTMSSELPGRMN